MPPLDLQKTLDKALAEQPVAGAVAMVGNAETVLACAASGLADPATGKPMALDAIFQIASMTKAVTSVAAMQLVERGLLSLDEPIDPVLPQLARPDLLTGFDPDGKPILQPASKPITLRHLLTHTSGLGYAFTSAGMARAQVPAQCRKLQVRSSSLISPPIFLFWFLFLRSGRKNLQVTNGSRNWAVTVTGGVHLKGDWFVYLFPVSTYGTDLGL